MSSTILSQVREHLKNNETIHLIDENNEITQDITAATAISFQENGFNDKIAVDQPTEFEIEGKPTDLKVIIHCYLNKDSSIADYLSDCQVKNITNVSFLHRTDLINWLDGKIESSKYIKSHNITETNDETINENKTTTNETNDTLTTASMASTAAASVNTSDLKGQPTSSSTEQDTSDPVLAEAMKHERILLDHNSSLRGSKPIDFGYLVKDVELKLIQSIKSSIRSSNKTEGHVSKRSTSSTVNKNKNAMTQKDPIILIPSAASSILTMSNIKQFLTESKYINPRDLPLSINNDLIKIDKKFDNIHKPLKFIVVNNTRMFTKPEYWDRVVAVLTTGHEWQFNNYQWNTPQELFQHTRGYFFHFNTDPVPQNVQQWNIQSIDIDKTTRFRDAETVRYFWNTLEKELLARGYR